jgi:mannose-6-phosphate isomerase-like protein (cupin superfamily)
MSDSGPAFARTRPVRLHSSIDDSSAGNPPGFRAVSRSSRLDVWQRATTNEHPRAEQWVFVISRRGVARVKGRTLRLKTGSLPLIEKGDAHQVTNNGKSPW